MREKKKKKFYDLKYSGPFEKGVDIAKYYGFRLIEPLKIKRVDKVEKLILIKTRKTNEPQQEFSIEPERRIAMIRTFMDEKIGQLPKPIMICHSEVDAYKKHGYLNLEIFATAKESAEAVLIHTAITILNNYKYKNLCVSMNSLGNKESLQTFTREITAYYRKHLSDLCPKCRETFKKDPFELIKCREESCLKLKLGAPKSINFLSEEDRLHFSNVLEYLEISEIPYVIDHNLLDNKNYCTKTVFEIKSFKEKVPVCNPETGQTVCHGGRYGNLSKKLGQTKKIEAVGLSIFLPKGRKRVEIYKKNISGREKKILFYLIQIGFNAKVKSLKVIEILRQAKIFVKQSIGKDSILVQITRAEKENIPYVIIIGQKEANEDTVIIRNIETRVQKVIPIKEMVSFVKKLKQNK
jgi:histidyl-tRNA synthetase